MLFRKKKSRLEKIIKYSLDWSPGYGFYHLFVKDDKRLSKVKDSYLIINALYHSTYIAGLLARILIKR